MTPMSPERIISLFDLNPDLTLVRLSRMSGYSVTELKTLLGA